MAQTILFYFSFSLFSLGLLYNEHKKSLYWTTVGQ